MKFLVLCLLVTSCVIPPQTEPGGSSGDIIVCALWSSCADEGSSGPTSKQGGGSFGSLKAPIPPVENNY
jgi:hypothetical protein